MRPAGAQSIAASYSGDSNYQGSSATLTQQVSYAFTLTGPGSHKTTVHVPQTLPISFTLSDAQGNPVTTATATLYVNGQPSTTGVGYSAGGDAFTVSGGTYRYLLKVTAADVVNGQVTLTVRLSDGTSQTLVLEAR